MIKAITVLSKWGCMMNQANFYRTQLSCLNRYRERIENCLRLPWKVKMVLGSYSSRFSSLESSSLFKFSFIVSAILLIFVWAFGNSSGVLFSHFFSSSDLTDASSSMTSYKLFLGLLLWETIDPDGSFFRINFSWLAFGDAFPKTGNFGLMTSADDLISSAEASLLRFLGLELNLIP